MFRHEEVRAKRLHQARPEIGRLHFGFYVEATYVPGAKSYHMKEFEAFDMKYRVNELFGGTNAVLPATAIKPVAANQPKFSKA
jgi:hypothetical protein